MFLVITVNSYRVLKNIEIENIVKIEIENKLPDILVKPITLLITCHPCYGSIPNA